MITKLERHDGMNITDNQWDEYLYLFDLISVEKRNPNLQGYHPQEEMYPLLKKIAECEIPYFLRNSLISLLEYEAE